MKPRPTISPKSLLLPYQAAWVNDAARFKIGVWSRQTGKSFSTASEAVEDCMTDPGTKWVCLSAGERQSLEWLEKAKEWASAYRLAIEEVAEDRESGEALLKSAEIRFAGGSRIIAIPANPATARGYSANVILDEFAYHDNPDAIWAAMFPSATNPLAGTFMDRVRALLKGNAPTASRNLKIRVVSTHNGQQGKFFNLVEKAAANGWSLHAINIHDAIKQGLPLNADELKAALDDPDIWAQEYENVPVDISTVLLGYELIAPCENPLATEDISPEFWATPPARPLYLGIDFGRKKDLTCCWTLEDLGGGYGMTKEVVAFTGLSTNKQFEILRHRIARAARVAFDYTGPGIGLGDAMVEAFGQWKPEQHKFGKVELVEFSNATKLEIFPKLRQEFDKKMVGIPVSRVIREDLHSVHRIVTDKGNMTYRAPHTADGHADRCTALALAVKAKNNPALMIGAAVG